mgnify:CR=1 FL=1
MATSAQKQVTQSARQAAQAVDARLASIAKQAKSKSSTKKSHKAWIGTITLNEAELDRLPLFLDIISKNRALNWAVGFIGLVAQQQMNGTPYQCDSESEAQELNKKTGKELGMTSPDNDRLAHDYGARLLGLEPYTGQKATALIKAGFKDAKFAAITVTK